MAEELKREEEEKEEEVVVKGKQEEDEEQVTLSSTQYNAILDRMQELEDAALNQRRKGPLSVDELAGELDEAPKKQPVQGAFDPNALEGMTNAQLVQFVFQAVERGIGQPLLVKLEEVRVKEEIKELRSLLKENDEDDFDELKDEIYKVASRNPNLSIKEAYRLAKKEEGGKSRKRGENEEEGTPKKKRDVLYTLPPRTRTHSEKPSHSRGATSEGAPESRMDAAKRAIEDMEKKGAFG